MHVFGTIVKHLRQAIDSIALHEGSLLIPNHYDSEDIDMPYQPDAALTIVDMTMKLIKSISDHGGKEHITYIIKTSPDITVSIENNK